MSCVRTLQYEKVCLRRTIRVWKEDGTAQVLEGHQGPVQCLLVLPNGSILSGGNDMTIRHWVDGKCLRTFQGHTDTVRFGSALLPLPDRTAWRTGVANER